MDNEKFQDLVLEQLQIINGELKTLNNRVGNLEEGQTRLEDRTNRLESNVTKLNNRFDNLQQSQQLLQHDIKKLQQGQQLLQQDVEKIRLSQVRMEFEHGEKLSALFDSYNLLSETLDDHTIRLQRIEDKIATHDIQIHVLDRTKSNKRKAK